MRERHQRESRQIGTWIVMGLIVLIAFGLARHWPMAILALIFAVMNAIAFMMWFFATGRSRRRPA